MARAIGSRRHDIGGFTAGAIASRRHDIGALRVTSNKSLVVCITAEFLFI